MPAGFVTRFQDTSFHYVMPNRACLFQAAKEQRRSEFPGSFAPEVVMAVTRKQAAVKRGRSERNEESWVMMRRRRSFDRGLRMTSRQHHDRPANHAETRLTQRLRYARCRFIPDGNIWRWLNQVASTMRPNPPSTRAERSRCTLKHAFRGRRMSRCALVPPISTDRGV